MIDLDQSGSVEHAREDRERGRTRRRISAAENIREMARDESSVKPKPKKKKKRRETMERHEGRRGPDPDEKREMKKRNEIEMANDRREALEDEREAKRRRLIAVDAVETVEKGRRRLRRGTNAAEGVAWNDGEVSFYHEALPERDEAAEARDSGGRRERSQSGAKEASETRKSKENG